MEEHDSGDSESNHNEVGDQGDHLDDAASPVRNRKRGIGKKKTPKSALQTTVDKWLKKHAYYTVKDVGAGVTNDWAGKATGLAFEQEKLVCASCTMGDGTLFTVSQDRRDHLAQHFGFGKCAPSKKHVQGLQKFWDQPVLTFKRPSVGTTKEQLLELQADLAEAVALGGLSFLQLEPIIALLKKWLPGVASKLPLDVYAILDRGLPIASAKVEEEAARARVGFQLHLSGDAATDERDKSVFLTTAEFDGGRSQLLDVAFPSDSLNHVSLGNLNMKIIARVGGYEKVDTYHHDGVSYGIKYGNEHLGGTYTRFLTDPCHRLDGVLDAMLASSVPMQAIISCLNNIFKSTNRSFKGEFSSYLDEQGLVLLKYPSPGETRAWTGQYRVLEWLYMYYDHLARFILQRFPHMKDPSTKMIELKEFFQNDAQCNDFKIVLVWFLQYTADLVTPIVSLQSRTIASVHTVFPTLIGLLSFMNYSNAELKERVFFREQVLMDDELLLTAYNNARDKSWVKDGIVNAIGHGRIQLIKNWGDVEKVITQDSWVLKFDDEGDSIFPDQVAFYAIAAALDPSNRTVQVPPERDFFLKTIKWNISGDEKDAILDQLRVFVKDGSVVANDATDIRLFWSSLGQSQRSKYGKLSRFAKRVLDTPGGSAEVERAVSIYNRVVTWDRSRLSDARVRDLVMIYANGNSKRQEKNDKRARKNLEAQKKKKASRAYQLNDQAFKPPRKKARAAPDE
jgi:hypothetical protein